MQRFIDGVIRDERPYSDLLVGKDVEINGPISHYYRHLSNAGYRVFESSPTQNQPSSTLSFDQTETWETMIRNKRHAGVLTLPAYLTKFSTARARANRFYNAFLCRSFEAPEGGLPASDDACHDEPDLTKRCGCKHCHASLEPAAAHWGRWAENALRPLNENEFPVIDQNCVNTPMGTRPSERCRQYYLLQAQHPLEAPYEGYLKSYVFADVQRQAAIEAGPEQIAQQALDSGAFARCTAKNLWAHLVDENRQLEDPIFDQFEAKFRDGYSFHELLEAIVSRPEYIKAGQF